ncbi:MAG: GWxTD domain-containing protein [candidate division Zixibacteria bacterium]|nr:GWxTD domain-containing protein [candidate division Zixibacteria bacterium]
MRKILSYALIVVGILTGQVLAQPLFYKPSLERQNILLNYASFAGQDQSQIRLEVYYQVYNEILPFRMTGGIYRADYEITIKVIGKDGLTVASHREERSVQVVDYSRTRSRTDYRIGQTNFELPTGKHRLSFVLSDKHSSLTFRRELKLNLKSLQTSKPKLSDIELVHATVAVDSASGDSSVSDFFKAGMEVVPSLTGLFGGEDDSRLLFYMEINKGTDCCDEVTVVTSLRHNRHGLQYRDSVRTVLDQPIVRQLREVSLTDFRVGEYEMNVQLRGRRWKKLDEKKVTFEVPWNQLTLLKHDYDEAVDQLEFIANPGETKRLRSIVSYEERLLAFNEFWASRDPNPSTAINELKVRFYHRINVADQRFSLMGRKGWRTDRGRILVEYGEPDQIDDYPFAMDRYPYQSWHYFEQGPYRKFTFVDEHDNGDYRLIYPYDGLDQRPGY